MLEASRVFHLGTCHRSGSDDQLGRNMGLDCRRPSLIRVTWWPPLPLWIKVNTDGSASNCPRCISAGGVFRDDRGTVWGCFHVDGGFGFAGEAEILAAITAIEIAHDRGWTRLWLETDSTYVAGLLRSSTTSVPCRFAKAWRRILSFIEAMEFRVSHIYREGNQVADLMAHPDTPSGWWPHAIPRIVDAVARDMATSCYFRRV